jgi:hypothetical protein
LKDVSSQGCEHSLVFAGIGFAGGAKGTIPGTFSAGEGHEFETQVPVDYKEFNCGGRVFIAFIGLGGGLSVARASFSAFETTPEWIDIGGFELGAGAHLGAYVGVWNVK